MTKNNKSVKNLISLFLPLNERNIKESGIKNPVYFSIELTNNRMVFGRSNAKINEFQTIERFKALKKAEHCNSEKVYVYTSKEMYDEERKNYNSLGYKK